MATIVTVVIIISHMANITFISKNLSSACVHAVCVVTSFNVYLVCACIHKDTDALLPLYGYPPLSHSDITICDGDRFHH